jgi:hypothetical protein
VNRMPVDSSVLVSVGYDSDGLVLEMEIVGGAVYQYFDVPEPVFLELMSATSHGKYYNQNIRNSYRCAQL